MDSAPEQDLRPSLTIELRSDVTGTDLEIDTFEELTLQNSPNSAENGFPDGRLWTRKNSPKSLVDDKVVEVDKSCTEPSTIPFPVERTRIELEKCRRALHDAIRRCFEPEFPYMACAISCILNSLRPLRAWEVDTAVGLYVEYSDVSRVARVSPGEDEASWLQRCASFLVIDENGLISFASRFMPQFLKNFRIRGVDVTHQTIATACLLQVDLDERSENSSCAESGVSSIATSHPAFSDYANKYWLDHCRCIEQSCQSLDGKSGSDVCARKTEFFQCQNAQTGSKTVSDLEQVALGQSDLDDEEVDWVLVEE